MAKYKGRGLVVKRPGVLSKVQMLNLVLGVGVFPLLPIIRRSVMSIKFPPVILGPEMAAGRLAFFGAFCWKTPHAHKHSSF